MMMMCYSDHRVLLAEAEMCTFAKLPRYQVRRPILHSNSLSLWLGC